MAALKPRRELLTIWRLYLVLCALIPAFLISLFCRVPGRMWLLLTGVWLLVFLALYAVYFPLLFAAKGFSVEREQVVSVGGVVYRHRHALPIANIQYVSVIEGPLDRVFRICSVVVVAAGGRMVIPGLRRTDGQNLVGILTEAATRKEDGGAAADATSSHM